MAKSKSILTALLLFVCSFGYTQQGNQLREQIAKRYTAQIGVRELTGNNDGKSVEVYLKYVGLSKGNPWCAAFVSWTYGQYGVKKARSGGCVQLMEQGITIYKSGKVKELPQKADAFFIWFAEKNRVAHTGFVDKWDEEWITTVEGNTNQAGSREGDGVYRKKRLKRQVYAVVKYL